jgi:hypothetical protein
MNRASLFTLMILLTVVVISSISSPLAPASNGVSLPKSGYSLESRIILNQFGQVYVNETLIESVNATSALQSITMGFPQQYSGHIFDIRATLNKGSGSISNLTVVQGTSNNTLTATIQPSLSPKQSASVSLTFYVLKIYRPISNSSGNYLVAPIVFYPAINVHLDSISSQMETLSTSFTIANGTVDGFSHTVATPLETWSYSTNNVTSEAMSFGNILISLSGNDAGELDFQNITRVISVNSEGRVIVNDYVKVSNLGSNTVSSLPFDVLTSGPVTILPSVQPPLSNIQTLNLTGGEVSLSSINGVGIEPNSSISFTMQYPLSNSYWQSSHGLYRVSVPVKLPVDAFVDYYSVKIELPSGISLESPVPQTYTATQVSNVSALLSFSYRQGIGSAFGFAMPIAIITFVVALAAGLLFRPRGGTILEEIESKIEELVKVVEEKVSGTNDVLSDLKAAGASLTRSDLLNSRARIEDVRTKSGSRIASLRTEILTMSPGSQGALTQLLSSDREFDRSVRDILNTYDQFVSKRMKLETFERVRSSNERRIQDAANSLLDSVRAVKRSQEV